MFIVKLQDIKAELNFSAVFALFQKKKKKSSYQVKGKKKSKTFPNLTETFTSRGAFLIITINQIDLCGCWYGNSSLDDGVPPANWGRVFTLCSFYHLTFRPAHEELSYLFSSLVHECLCHRDIPDTVPSSVLLTEKNRTAS